MNFSKSADFIRALSFIRISKLFILLLFLPGCLNYYQEVTLYPDGSGKMKIDYWMKFDSEESAKVVDKLGIFNPDSIRSGFQTEYSQVNNVKVYSDTTDSTTHALIELSFDHIDSLNKTKVFTEYNFSHRWGRCSGELFFGFI